MQDQPSQEQWRMPNHYKKSFFPLSKIAELIERDSGNRMPNNTFNSILLYQARDSPPLLQMSRAAPVKIPMLWSPSPD
jgi:hypothetical protein